MWQTHTSKSAKTSLALLLGLCFFLNGCASSSSDDESDDTSNSELASAVSEVGEIVNGSSTRAPFSTERGACSGVNFGGCSSSTKTRAFSTDGGDTGGCTRGSGAYERTVFGKAILTFSDSGCAQGNGDSITRTLTNHFIEDSAGRRVLIYTGEGTVGGKTLAAAALLDYEGTSRSGGSVVTKGSSSDTLSITGIHRRAVRATGKYGFWHTLYTSTPLIVTRSGSTSTISSGTVVLMHNRAKVKVTKTFTDVIFDTGCNYPTSGTIQFDLVPQSGTASSFTVTFSSTCGAATVDGTSTTLGGGGS